MDEIMKKLFNLAILTLLANTSILFAMDTITEEGPSRSRSSSESSKSMLGETTEIEDDAALEFITQRTDMGSLVPAAAGASIKTDLHQKKDKAAKPKVYFSAVPKQREAVTKLRRLFKRGGISLLQKVVKSYISLFDLYPDLHDDANRIKFFNAFATSLSNQPKNKRIEKLIEWRRSNRQSLEWLQQNKSRL